MLIELKPLKRKGDEQVASVLRALGQVVADYHQQPHYQQLLRHAHVAFDWIQYKQNFRPPIAECPAFDPDGQTIHRREVLIDLRQIEENHVADQLRHLLDRWAPASAASEQPRQEPPPAAGERLYFEPFQPARNSIIWSFNALFWNALDKWEATFQKGYEASLPGSVTDACNPDFVAQSVKHICQVLEELRTKGQLPEQIFVLEIGVGNGTQARTWLDEFQRYTRETQADFYDRLHYLMSDFSLCVLNAARQVVTPHLGKVSFLVVDATDPLKSLSFLRYKLMFIHISNVYDNLPSSELIRWDGQYYLVEVRAYLPRSQAEQIAARYHLAERDLAVTISRFLKIGPDYFDDSSQGVHFWAEVWQALKLEERCILLPDLSQLALFEGFDGLDVQRLLEHAGGNIRMHLNEMGQNSNITILTTSLRD
jgi:hypothetical protein